MRFIDKPEEWYPQHLQYKHDVRDVEVFKEPSSDGCNRDEDHDCIDEAGNQAHDCPPELCDLPRPAVK